MKAIIAKDNQFNTTIIKEVFMKSVSKIFGMN